MFVLFVSYNKQTVSNIETQEQNFRWANRDFHLLVMVLVFVYEEFFNWTHKVMYQVLHTKLIKEIINKDKIN